MTVPPDQPAEHDGTAPSEQPVSLDKLEQPADLDFDPYRFGAPEHPVPPEYAPPGYRPPQPRQPQPPAGYQPPPPQYAPQGQPSGYTPPQYRSSPPPPAYGVPYYGPPPRRGTGKAIAAMVLGISSILLSILSFLDLILIVLAIVFGVIALNESKRSPQREGRGMAIAGLACAAVGTILAIVLTTWFVNAAEHCDQYDSSSSQFQSCFRDHL